MKNPFKKLIKSMKLRYYTYKVNTENKDLEDRRKKNQLICVHVGHSWKSEYSPKIVNAKKLKERLYCNRCGVYYYEPEYKKDVQIL